MNRDRKTIMILSALLVAAVAVGPGCFRDGPLRTDNGRVEVADNRPDIGIPYPDEAKERSPDTYRVKVETTKGDFVIECRRMWAPNGADRFYNMVKIGYFEDICIFRAVEGFMFQFGIHGRPEVNRAWGDARFIDDNYAGISNTPGRLTFANTGQPNSRSSQLFITTSDQSALDSRGFLPIGEVIEGMDILYLINTEYGETTTNLQGQFAAAGNSFMQKNYPNLDYIKSIRLVEDSPSAPEDQKTEEATKASDKVDANTEGSSGNSTKQ